MNAKLCDLCKNVIVHPVPSSPIFLGVMLEQHKQHGAGYSMITHVQWEFNGDICRSCFFEIVKESLASELKQP